MSQSGHKPGPVKLYLRIGEVAEIVGVQPHVLRYWESEFKGSIRPQKSKKGQRVYSRQDVERLMKVKDLLRNQGFTIAGARKVLRESASAARQVTRDGGASVQSENHGTTQPQVVQPQQQVSQALVSRGLTSSRPSPVVPFAVFSAPAANPAAEAERSNGDVLATVPTPEPRGAEQSIVQPQVSSGASPKRLRRALVELRQDVVQALSQIGSDPDTH